MTLSDIALRSLRRRKAKALFVLSGLLLAVATAVMLTGLVEAMRVDIARRFDRYGANIVVTPKTESLSLSYGGFSVGGISLDVQHIPEEDLVKLKSIKNAGNIAATGPMVLGAIDAGHSQVLLAGIDFRAQDILRPWWKVHGDLPGKEGVLVGAEAARVLELSAGDHLHVSGRELLVSGVLEPTGSQDDQLVFAHLPVAQELLGKQGQISMAEIAALCTACPIPEMVRQISEVLPSANVLSIQQVVDIRMETLRHFRDFSFGVTAVVVVMGSLMALVTMMASVRERTAEIGIFQAIGFRRSHVIHIVLLEAGVLSALAGVLGYLMGLGATKVALPFFVDSQGVAVSFNPILAAAALGLALAMGLAASAYPALSAARLDPSEALRAL